MSTVPAVRSIDAQALIAQAIERGTDPSALERLVALGERMLALQARQNWVTAMTQAQQEFPPIEKSREAKTRTYKYSYAPLDAIDPLIKPVLHKHNLVMTWQYDSSRPGEVGANCRIMHALGHYEDSGFLFVPIEPASNDGKGATPAQRAGIAATYARRYSCCAACGIVPHGEDPDGKDPEDDESGAVKRADGSVLVVEVNEVKGGKPGQRGWTRYDVHFDDGSLAATFDAGLAKAAMQAKADGALMLANVKAGDKGVDLLSLFPAGTGPVQDALDGFEAEVSGSAASAPDLKLERELLNSNILAMGTKAKLKQEDRVNAWNTYVGQEYTALTAPIEKLNDLLAFFKTRAGA